MLLPFLSAPLSALFFTSLYEKHLGGYTGDALGAAADISRRRCA
ncbi:hypothetical protein [Treponema endosymbiont of Eucomonympha sp.]|nr:hypothetical protein [Treponema endosymbiont of Eucomonympha sp.]